MNATTDKDDARRSAQERAAEVAFNPNYTSSNSEVRGAVGGKSALYNPEDGTVKLGSEQKQGGNALASQFRGITVGATRHAADGRVDYQLDVESVVAGSRQKSGLAETTTTAGGRGRYRVSLPEGIDADPTQVNPFDPLSIPKGGSVTLDGQEFKGTALSTSFKNIAAQSQVTDANGASYRVDRLDDGRVRVTTGPNEAVEGFNGIGFSAKGVTAVAGRQDALGQSSVRTGTFDLTQADGQQAYQQFLDTGRMEANTPGIEDLATVERLGMSSQTRLKVGVGTVFGIDVAGAQNSGDVVRVTRDDGSYTEQRSVQYSGNLPVTRVSAFGADGQELTDQRRYQFTFDLRDKEHAEQTASLLNSALSGSTSADARGPVKAGEINTLSFSEDQLRTLMERTQGMVQANPMMGPRWQLLAEDGQGQPQQDVDAYAMGLARNLGQSEYGMAEQMFRIAVSSKGADGQGMQKIEASVDGAHLRNLPQPSPLLPSGHDPRNASSADHPLWLQSQGAVTRLDERLGRQPDASTDRLGMALLVAATHKGMDRIDQAVLSDDAKYAFAVQGEPHDADRQIARTETARAVATSVDEHVQELQQAKQAQGATQQASSDQQALDQQQEQTTQRAMGR